MQSSDIAVVCEELVQVYPSAGGPVFALRGVSFDLPRGTLTTVVGPSGAGKSTLLRLLGGLERPTAGDLVMDGERTALLSGRRRRQLVARHIGHVFQIPRHNLLGYLTVRQHISLAWRMRSPAQAMDVEGLAAEMDLTGAFDSKPDDLAVGEQQRLAFAMAVAGGPTLIVADEPTASLDPAGASTLIAALQRLISSGQSLVIATHDDRLLALSHQVLVIRGGVLASAGTVGSMASVVDSGGRLALDPEAASLFPNGRATVQRDADRGLWVSRP